MLGGLIAAATSGWRSQADKLNDPNCWTPGWGGGQQTRAGAFITPDKSLSLPTYWAAIRVLSEDVAKTPLKVYRALPNDDREPFFKHPAYRLLHAEPTEFVTPFQFKQTLTQWAVSWGNGFAEIRRTPGATPTALEPIHPARVAPELDDAGKLWYYRVYESLGNWRTVEPQDMFHLRGFGDHLMGYSLAKFIAETIGLGVAQIDYSAAFFGNGAHAGTIFRFGGSLGEAERKVWADHIKEKYARGQAFNAMILPAAMEVLEKQVGIPPDDAQLVESREFTVEEIARAARVNPNKLQHWKRTTFNNIEQANIDHVGDTLLPWYTRWEEEINLKLIQEQDEEVYAQFVVKGLLRGDIKARTEFYQAMMDRAVYNINDVLKLEDERPIGPLGDTRMVQKNMQPLEHALKPPEPPPALPAPQPGPPPRDEPTEIDTGVYRLSYGPILESVVAAAVRKMLSASERAVKRIDSATGRGAWVDEFCDRIKAELSENVAPCAASMAALMGRDARVVAPDISTVTEVAIIELVRRWRVRLTQHMTGPPISWSGAESGLSGLVDDIAVAVMAERTKHATAGCK